MMRIYANSFDSSLNSINCSKTESPGLKSLVEDDILEDADENLDIMVGL